MEAKGSDDSCNGWNAVSQAGMGHERRVPAAFAVIDAGDGHGHPLPGDEGYRGRPRQWFLPKPVGAAKRKNSEFEDK